MVQALGFVVAVLFCLRCAASVDIDTTDGAYKHILVSISDRVPPNDSIIDDIKVLFRSSSMFLHNATDGRVYFKHIEIRVPHTWPKRSGARPVSSNAFHRSDVRVDLPENPHKDVPYTKQLTPCGHHGEYIQLTPGFLASVRSSAAMRSLIPAYTFVHEWAHFKYGLFDEYGRRGDDKLPLTYCDTKGRVQVNSCSHKIVFDSRTANGEVCEVDNKCRIQDDCKVTFYTKAKDAVDSSIMFMPPVKSVSHFCDNGTTRRHNWLAPNKHNSICKQRSSWDVIRMNDDFKGHTMLIGSKEIHVTFDEAQRQKGLVERVVLVLDVSGSMAVYDRIAFLKEAVLRYIKNIEDDTRRLAIVAFSDNSTVVHPLKLVDVNTKQGFLDAVTSIEADGSTCIGCGLRTALNLLRESNEAPEGAFIVLMTDGEENRSPIIENVLPEIVASKVIVFTVALVSSADNNLESIALKTHGKAFGFPDLSGRQVDYLESFFVSSTTTQDGSTAPIWALMDEDRELKGALEVKFTVGPSLGNSTVAHVREISGGGEAIAASLVDPTGRPCQQCRETRLGDETAIEIPSPAMAGTWTLQLRSSTSNPVRVGIWIKSEPRKADSEPFRASSEVRTVRVNGKNAPFVYAEVTKGKKVVLGAVVYARVFRPMDTLNSRHSVEIRLEDDGLDPDVQANDGAYSGYFTQYIGKGRYSVTVSVSAQGITRLADPPRSSGSFFTIASLALAAASNQSCSVPSHAYPISCFRLVNTSTLKKTTATRKATPPPSLPPRVKSQDDLMGALFGELKGPSWYVTDDIQEKDFPPGDIKDLAVTNVWPENNTLSIRLEWTWPGVHLTNGMASGLDLRAAKHKANLEKDFENQIPITMADVEVGHLNALVARSPHDVTLRVPRALASPREDGALIWNGYIAAQISNIYGLSSDPSNIVHVSYVPPVKSTRAVRTEATTDETPGTKTRTTKPKTRKATTRQTTIRQASTTAEGIPSEKSRSEVPPWFWILSATFAAAVLIVVLAAAARVLKHEKGSRITDAPTLATTSS